MSERIHNSILHKKMEPFGSSALATALVASTLLAVRATRKKTLTTAGAATGFAVGFVLVSTGLRGLILFYFYQLGSMATKYKKSIKATMDATVDLAAVRGPTQVLSVSVVAVVLSCLHAFKYGAEQPISFREDGDTDVASKITCGVLAHHATCLADTLASELGLLAKKPPVLVTQPWRRVPPGTNGGVTLNGFFWSFVGGACVGVFYVMTDLASGVLSPRPGRVVLFGGLCGVLGSLLDSILGALVQATYFDEDNKKVYHVREKSAKHISGLDLLSNENVNLVSVAATSYVSGWFLAPWFFGST